MSKWKEILETAKKETRKNLVEEIRDLSILSESEIELVAPSDLEKSYLRNIFSVIQRSDLSEEKKFEYVSASSGSHLIINLLERFVVC